jgi:molybdopterin converting factor small subunit
VKVLLFAGAAQAADRRELSTTIPIPCSIGELAEQIEAVEPRLTSIMQRSRFAIDQQFVSADDCIERLPSEIALIPPVSGG